MVKNSRNMMLMLLTRKGLIPIKHQILQGFYRMLLPWINNSSIFFQHVLSPIQQKSIPAKICFMLTDSSKGYIQILLI